MKKAIALLLSAFLMLFLSTVGSANTVEATKEGWQ